MRKLRWIENWLNSQAWNMVINGMKFRWESEPSWVPVLGLMYVNDLDDGAEYAYSKRVHDTKLGVPVCTPEELCCHPEEP